MQRNIVKRKKMISKVRRSVLSVYNELGPQMFRRAFRMSYQAFNILLGKLGNGIKICSESETGHRRHVHNGRIPSSVRLAIALRYFAGASLYDLSLIFHVSYVVAQRSIWYVVDAVNKYCGELQIKYPTNHAEQQRIADGFCRRSAVNFSGCAGCIDGVLIWMNKPSKKDCSVTTVGQSKFYCGRKQKFGLNLQAVCDSNCRFLDVSIIYGGATSDFLAFKGSDLKNKLEKGMLKEGLHLFGDNAYVNTMYMATPFSGIRGRCAKDSYNFFHSQLRITIERSFGLFVHRWAFFRKPAPVNMSVKRLIALTICLCKLHNFCIDHREGVQQLTVDDQLHLIEAGGILPRHLNGRPIVEREFMDSGRNMSPEEVAARRTFGRNIQDEDDLPRNVMLGIVEESGRCRPT